MSVSPRGQYCTNFIHKTCKYGMSAPRICSTGVWPTPPGMSRWSRNLADASDITAEFHFGKQTLAYTQELQGKQYFCAPFPALTCLCWVLSVLVQVTPGGPCSAVQPLIKSGRLQSSLEVPQNLSHILDNATCSLQPGYSAGLWVLP